MSILECFWKRLGKLGEGSDETYEHPYLESTQKDPQSANKDESLGSGVEDNLSFIHEKTKRQDEVNRSDLSGFTPEEGSPTTWVNEGRDYHKLDPRDYRSPKFKVFYESDVAKKDPLLAHAMHKAGIKWVSSSVFYKRVYGHPR